MENGQITQNQKPLAVPDNASDRNDIIRGIGSFEATVLGITFVAVLIMVLIALLSGGNMVFWIFFAIFVMFCVVLLVQRDNVNESLIDKIRYAIRYHKSQKEYEYVFNDILQVDWESEEPDGDGDE